MPAFDAFHVARAQFAFTIAFHIVLPAFSIGLASYLMVLEALWLRTRQRVYLDVFRFWIKIFAVGFAMGVVSGLVMSYQFGTNWSVFADRAGPVVGPVMGYEVLTAFFLEAGFLGVMLFGTEKVGRGLHFFATCMVAGGTLLSAFWILSVNSWMQTPAGYSIGPDGRFLPEDWWAIIFNPSFHVRFPHMVLASYLSVAFVVGATGAWHLLADRRARRPQNPAAKLMFSMAMWMAALVAPAQIVMGDIHGLNTLQHQPAKIAAMEGNWDTQSHAPLLLFGIPNMATEQTDYAIEIPQLSSLILTHSLDGVVPGLKDFPRADRPNSLIVFWSFRIMVGIGMLMALVGAISLFLRWRQRLYDAAWLHGAVLLMGPSGFVALLAGWVTTEVGRQPYTVLRHAPHHRQRLPHRTPRRRHLARRLRRRLPRRLHRRLRHPPAHDGPHPPTRRARPRPRNPHPNRRHHTRRRPVAPRLRRRAGRRRMNLEGWDLTPIWAGLLAFAVLAYVLLDGFDLGVGILFAAERGEEDRDLMVNTIAPVWDGNETWLVLGGGGLFAVFPLAYAIIMPALYPTIMGMLLALVFRGVAFEFRFRAHTRGRRRLWDFAFFSGSAVAALCQGMTLGGLLQGVHVNGRAYAGGWWDWLTPLHHPLRDRRRRRLRAPRRHLADLAHRTRRPPRPLPQAGHPPRHRHPRLHRRRQPLDPLPPRALPHPLVRLARHPPHQPRPPHRRRARPPLLPQPLPRQAPRPAPLRPSPVHHLASPASASAWSRSWSPPASPSGTPPHRTPAKPSCWSAPRC